MKDELNDNVVRCKDCFAYGTIDDDYSKPICRLLFKDTNENDYCGAGIPKHHRAPNDVSDITMPQSKLKSIEEIEKEIGIDVTILFKALSDGIWFNDRFIPGRYLAMDGWRILIMIASASLPLFLSPVDYGKTWALTKEELKNGKGE